MVERCEGEIRGDPGRPGEIWVDPGRSGEIWGDLGHLLLHAIFRCEEEKEAARANMARLEASMRTLEAWGDVGRCVGRCEEMCGER